MFKPEQYRAKATEYGDLAKSSISPKQSVDFEKLERSFSVLADNEQWLAENYQNTLGGAQREQFGGVTLADEEEHILRCLGAALIMQWNTLPTELQRKLFDNAGSMGELLDAAALRGQIARFLRKRTHHEDETTMSSVQS